MHIQLRCQVWSLLLFALGTSAQASAPECFFDVKQLSFKGTAKEQAECLLRPIKIYGKTSTIQKLPKPLSSRVGKRISISTRQLKNYLSKNRLNHKQIGGLLGRPLSKVNYSPRKFITAKYFVIHDTSYPNFGSKKFPEIIDKKNWPGNRLRLWKNTKVAHVFINRVGNSITSHDFSVPWRATKLEMSLGKRASKGLFLHVELVQPRRNDILGRDAFAPRPGFTQSQLRRLALVYIAASVRKGRWLIPAFHAVLDEKFSGGHDDPQNFDLQLWANQIEVLHNEIKPPVGKT